MYIVMLGKPGSGKGTVGKMLSESLGIIHISSGELFRNYIKKAGEIGKKIDSYVSKGNLVPDELAIELVEKRLLEPDCKNGVILDGFPRTIAQAEKLDEMLAKKGNKIDMVINLTTPRDEIIERILTRRVCSNQDCKATYNLVMHPPKVEGICDKCGAKLTQREDDKSEEAINNRLEIYDTQTAPVLKYYEEKGIVQNEEITISKNRMADEAAKHIIEKLK